MIGFIGTSITITMNYNSFQSTSVYDSLHFFYRTTSAFSSTVTNKERKITVHTLNDLIFGLPESDSKS
jgi:hypothetical protein